jgi:hypothetical protein
MVSADCKGLLSMVSADCKGVLPMVSADCKGVFPIMPADCQSTLPSYCKSTLVDLLYDFSDFQSSDFSEFLAGWRTWSR